jgi:hypothetical protein
MANYDKETYEDFVVYPAEGIITCLSCKICEDEGRDELVARFEYNFTVAELIAAADKHIEEMD